MFKLSRRAGSAKWQVRKRWPSDVAAILRGEFNASTGEEDKRLAQQRLPFISAEYERRVAEARRELATVPREVLSEAEAHRMAAEFYRTMLPRYAVQRPMEPIEHQQLLAGARRQLETARAMLGRNNFGSVLAVSRTLAKKAGLSLSDESPAMEQLRRHLMVAFVQLQEAAVARLSGDEGPLPSASQPLDASSAPQDTSKTLEALIEAYETDKAPRWSGSTKKGVAPVFRFLREVFPGRDVAGITREDARGAVKLLEALPTMMGRRKELAGLSVPKAIEKGRALKLPTIQPKTVNDGYLLHIASMFNWARKEQWVASNPFEGLTVHDPVDDADRRDPFTVEQLRTLLTQAPWDAPWKPGGAKPGVYWVPLLCLFHGLRNGEAAGLRVADVDEQDGVPVLHIRAYDGKRLKTKDSRGTLALHPELIRMGFLAHVEARREAGEALLFPEGVVNERGQVAAKLGERFSDRIKRMGFEGRKLGMHSFRHCFEDRLRAAELPDRTALALARRTEAGSSRIYGDGLSARQKAEAVAKVVYPGLDLSHLHRPAE